MNRAAFLLLACVAGLAFAGCAQYDSFAANHDRDYTAAYDVTSGTGSLSGRITSASVPGQGRRSIGWAVTGKTQALYPDILAEQPRIGGDGKAVIR